MTPEEARQRASEKRASFLDAVDAVQKKVGVEAVKLESALDEANKLRTKAEEVVKAHPWLFVLGALALGVALGTRRTRPRRLRAPEAAYYAPPPPPGVVGALFDGLAGVLQGALDRVLSRAFDELKGRFFEPPPPPAA